MPVTLRCPVRACGEALNRRGAPWTCSRNHSFDQHRTGFLNLLQPQDRRSNKPGDSREAAQARRRLAEGGHAEAVYSELRRLVEGRSQGQPMSLLDVGCGEGAFLRVLGDVPRIERHGTDLSAASLALAARATPTVLFVVANADRLIPYSDQSFDLVTSIDARINPGEFNRLLKPSGLVLVAVPGPDDLLELRERIQGAGVAKSRAAHVVEALANTWSLVDRTLVRDIRNFDPAALRDLLTVTYRGFRQSERVAVDSLTPMQVTLSHEVLVFQRRVRTN